MKRFGNTCRDIGKCGTNRLSPPAHSFLPTPVRADDAVAIVSKIPRFISQLTPNPPLVSFEKRRSNLASVQPAFAIRPLRGP
jgi:hypothetical protein